MLRRWDANDKLDAYVFVVVDMLVQYFHPFSTLIFCLFQFEVEMIVVPIRVLAFLSIPLF